MDPVERVKDLVRHALVTNPKIKNKELLEKAKEVAPEAVDGLSLVQFHARFRLPIMRNEMRKSPEDEKEPRRPRRRPAPKPAAVIRADLREILVRFAVELEGATSRSDLVRTVAGLDSYVDEVLKVARAYFATLAAGEETVKKSAPAPSAALAEKPAPPPLLEARRPAPPVDNNGQPTPPPGRTPPMRTWPPRRPPNPFRDP